MTTGTIKVSLWRGGAQGRYQVYQVPLRENQTVLDVVTFVQRHLDPSLSYRFACRVGLCGSCAMTVNGRPRWSCRTHVAKVLKRGAHCRGCRYRMHQLRYLLCRLRYGALESRLSRTGGAQSCLVTVERRARCRQSRAPRGCRRVRRLSCLPLAPVLSGAVPASAQSDCIHRRAQAPCHAGLSQRRHQGMNMRLYVWQRVTAAIIAPLVLVHVAV